jgi:hypothetical protein
LARFPVPLGELIPAFAAAFLLQSGALPDIRCGRFRPVSERKPWFAAIAQLVEHVIRNDGVTGSNPVCGTSIPFDSFAIWRVSGCTQFQIRKRNHHVTTKWSFGFQTFASRSEAQDFSAIPLVVWGCQAPFVRRLASFNRIGLMSRNSTRQKIWCALFRGAPLESSTSPVSFELAFYDGTRNLGEATTLERSPSGAQPGSLL